MNESITITYHDGSTRKFTLVKCDTLIKRTVGMLAERKQDDTKVFYIAPCNAIHTFFMAYPIDVIFVDKYLNILKVESVKRYRTSSCRNAFAVFEGTSLLKCNIPVEKVSFNC